ncbi:glycosyl hydrolase family 115 (putative glucuronidase) [Thermoflavifilum aggregans]|uniref:Glycosyl hydrolase family 115 (Putative glucuronidase) n=1 Tax=Thermoflavifilum aggregans TaxID=454188 RepID=A0A2M9CUT2_9BACT|nr:glycosyl hydrolase 115 family protein [Thermoflavifilum aggregans]PJJ75639.1 glycosyl hydrolase family 115 (putative glucuronidase) [Thermoflavifilum aggregans]
MKKVLFLAGCLGLIKIWPACAQMQVSHVPTHGAFPLVSEKQAAVICVDPQDEGLVQKVAGFFQQDLERVTGKQAVIAHQPRGKFVVIIGTIGKSAWIHTLVQRHVFDTVDLSGKWETFKIQLIRRPIPGVEQALVIAGSDRRGVAYGVFTISRQMGVSPWYWWADVPVKRQPNLFISLSHPVMDYPRVKYRGIFLNDEAPALSGWVKEKYGGFNHLFYEKVFELILRLRGNYLWPAMWGSAFNLDDTLNPILANEYGIVMGTSHHEPMMRAQQEWIRLGHGPWDYQTNDSVLRAFWREGIEHMDHHESIVTIGMRGNGDMPMSDTANIALLERIVHDQRQIIAEVTGKPASETPQDWALYKEVQEYYDRGMRVPDDVTLLFSDDNWGNIRRLPELKDSSRPGGFGVYYHFDYVGDPRNYKWLNTNQVERVWEQMHLAYAWHARRIWIVNVGDLKPMELPISFFLDYAWNPDLWPASRLPDYYRQWAAEQFNDSLAAPVAYFLAQYTKFNARRKPELLTPFTYSLTHYDEAERVVQAYQQLADSAQHVYDRLDSMYRDAYYQLVLYPILACANLNELYVTVGKNRLYALQGRAITNSLADKAHALYERDSLLSFTYNHVIAHGKWNHMMDQSHIGYIYWQEPGRNFMPITATLQLPDRAEMGVDVAGGPSYDPHDQQTLFQLPICSPFQTDTPLYVDIYNKGLQPFHVQLHATAPWIQLSATKADITSQQQIQVRVNWQQAPQGWDTSWIHILASTHQAVHIRLITFHPDTALLQHRQGFIESNGYVSIEAPHATRIVNDAEVHWIEIPNLGRTSSAMTIMPVTASPVSADDAHAHLEYNMLLFDTGKAKVTVYLSPTLPFHKKGLRYAIAFDDDTPQIVNMNADDSDQTWAKHVSDNINMQITIHYIHQPGWHTLKCWVVDPGVVLQKIVVDMGGEQSSYLGPPESYRYP